MMQAERSAGVSFSHRSIFRAISTRFSCVTGTRLEVPVVPDVRKITAQDCAVTGESRSRAADWPDLFERNLGERCDGLRGLEEADAVPRRTRPIGQGCIGGHDQGIEAIRSSSARRSAGGRLVLMGSTVAVQQTAMLSSAASGPRGRAMPTREAGPMPAARSCAPTLPDGAREITE